MRYLLFYEKIPDYIERQKPWHAAHLEHFEKFAAKGYVVLGGSLEDPVDGSALILCEADSADEIRAFAEDDPYVKHGIVNKWSVRKWDVVVGSALAKN
jgi:uncharacterized protein YciI